MSRQKLILATVISSSINWPFDGGICWLSSRAAPPGALPTPPMPAALMPILMPVTQHWPMPPASFPTPFPIGFRLSPMPWLPSLLMALAPSPAMAVNATSPMPPPSLAPLRTRRIPKRPRPSKRSGNVPEDHANLPSKQDKEKRRKLDMMEISSG